MDQADRRKILAACSILVRPAGAGIGNTQSVADDFLAVQMYLAMAGYPGSWYVVILKVLRFALFFHLGSVVTSNLRKVPFSFKKVFILSVTSNLRTHT